MDPGPAFDQRPHILIVDDEEEVLRSLRRLLRRHYDVHIARSAADAMAILDIVPIEVVLSDQRMPDITGAEFLAQVNRKHPDVVRVLLTGYADLSAVIASINEGHIFRYITKPWKPEELPEIVEAACAHHRMIRRAAGPPPVLVGGDDNRGTIPEEPQCGKEKLGAILECLPVGVVAFDRQGRVEWMNSEAERVLGWERAELARTAGDHLARIFSTTGDKGPLARVLLDAVVLRSVDVAITRRDGRTVTGRASAGLWYCRHELEGVLVTFEDTGETSSPAESRSLDER